MTIAHTIQHRVDTLVMGSAEKLPDLVLAIAVLFITWVFARVAVRWVRRGTRKTEIRENLRQLSETIVRVSVWLVGLLTAATLVVPGLTPASLFAGLGFGAVAIGFAFKDIFENFLAGVLIMLREKMEIGDVVEVNGILGKVERITLRETHMRQFSGELTILPNSTIFTNPVKIITDQVVRRNELVIGISYDADLAQAEQAIRAALASVTGIAEEPKVDVYTQDFGASSIDFLVRWWTDTSAHDYLGIKSEVIAAIKRALDEADIEIPFPQVTHTFKDSVPLAKSA